MREIQIRKENLLYYAVQRKEKNLITEEEIIEQALANPIGNVSLEDIPVGAKVAIIVDDATRPTPSRKIIPYLLRQIVKKSSNVTFITAPGTHRSLTDEELERKIGKI